MAPSHIGLATRVQSFFKKHAASGTLLTIAESPTYGRDCTKNKKRKRRRPSGDGKHCNERNRGKQIRACTLACSFRFLKPTCLNLRPFTSLTDGCYARERKGKTAGTSAHCAPAGGYAMSAAETPSSRPANQQVRATTCLYKRSTRWLTAESQCREKRKVKPWLPAHAREAKTQASLH